MKHQFFRIKHNNHQFVSNEHVLLLVHGIHDWCIPLL